MEHFVFRAHALKLVPKSQRQPAASTFSKNAFENYDLSAWSSPSRLPSGIPAIAASVLSFGLVVPSMDQVWFVGPIAKTTGDIGFEMALVLTAIFYVPLRYVEVKMRKAL